MHGLCAAIETRTRCTAEAEVVRVTNVAPPLLILTGPTAAGKSALALDLCRRFPLEIISADTVQVYRGLNIGSAKPSLAERAVAPHHLIDICDVHQSYSAARFCTDAWRLASDITARGRIAAVVGGAMFYLHALQSGLSAMPAADVHVRRQIADEARACGWPAMHEQLRRLDPRAAARIATNDKQRIARALEVHIQSGRPLSAQQGHREAHPPYRVLRLGLTPADRAVLHARIARRADAMWAAGLLEETRELLRVHEACTPASDTNEVAVPPPGAGLGKSTVSPVHATSETSSSTRAPNTSASLAHATDDVMNADDHGQPAQSQAPRPQSQTSAPQSHVPPAPPALRSVGYAEACAHLRGSYNAEQMRTHALAATRQLAKRQLGWMRHQPGTVWVNSEVPAHALATATNYLQHALAQKSTP